MAPIALKRLAARDLKTTYCYDVPDLVEGALRALWSERLASGESEPAMPPGRLSKFQEVRKGMGKEQPMI